MLLKNLVKKEIKKTFDRRDASYISSSDSDSDWLMPTTEDGNLDKVGSKYHSSTNQNKHKVSDVFASYTKNYNN